ncbi:RraA family protein [Caproiciproducens faecalis]|uniref:Putative 4-hydroxy-4-methyl-2-oxoglutarate aldolase n=1 Tax=Caproiciproducens faecalis TaxID=2820301 RepID=A0ABS7DPH5_9FIRM|nr:RraA family protein [Caproiciproducens faecalis]MBW7573204.1 RraA family protein [Caproiciproducens faecalis]
MKYLSTEQLEELREFDTPTVWNALEGFKIRPNTTGFCYPGMLLRTPNNKPMVGYAVTAKVSGVEAPTAEQKEMMFSFFEDVRKVEAPSIAIVQDVDKQPIGSFWGEVQATTFMALGAVGTLTQGGVRDLNEVGPLGFYFFSTDIMVARAESHLTDHDCPVEICGLAVNPGDLIHADRHGVTVIPSDIAPKLAEACRRVAKSELLVLEPCRKAIQTGIKPTVEQLRQWRGDMAKLR